MRYSGRGEGGLCGTVISRAPWGKGKCPSFTPLTRAREASYRTLVYNHANPTPVCPQVRRKLSSTYEKFEKKGLQLPEQLRQRAKSKLYSQVRWTGRRSSCSGNISSNMEEVHPYRPPGELVKKSRSSGHLEPQARGI